MTLPEEFAALKSRFQDWKAMNESAPTDPAFALVRATNEQTLAIYVLGALIAQLMTPTIIAKPFTGDPT